jgi:hypothetical protein
MKYGEKKQNIFWKLNRANESKKYVTIGLTVLLILSTVMLTFSNVAANSRTGTIANQPGAGFSADTEFFEIYHANDIHDTSYLTAETVNLRLNSSLVDWAAGGGGRRNEWELFDYYGNSVDSGQFAQQAGGPPYIYDASFTAPVVADHYLVYVRVRESQGQGDSEIETSDVIVVGGGATPSKHIVTYGTSAVITPKWVFGNAEIIYTSLYAPNTIDTANSDIIFSDMLGNNDRIAIENLADPTITIIGSDAAIAFDLANDLDLNQLTWPELNASHWYTIGFDLQDGVGGQMATDWAAQIKILPPPMINFTECAPNAIDIEGTGTTTIFTEFFDEDAIGNNEFIVTFKVRDPNNNEITLVDNMTNGNGGLTVTPLGIANWYNASYTWDPGLTAMPGDYDLFARIFDSQSGMDIDDFDNNPNELSLQRATQPPAVTAGNVTCNPVRINKMTTEFTNLQCNFTDDNDPALTVDDFTVSFKVRDPSSNEIIIADQKQVGDSGDAVGAGNINMASTGTNLFSAIITWDPVDTVEVGKYDLFFNVSSPYGTATDNFDSNPNELEIYSTGNAPQLTVGDTSCIPSSLDKIGTGTTLIYCEFTDADNPPVTDFNVTFKIRPPNNSNPDAITLVDNKAHGGAAETGGTVSVQQSGTKYTASYTWDPDDFVEVGNYDLYFMVVDSQNNSAEDPFPQNLDELEIITSVEPPTITAGNTNCLPSSVNKLGTGTTTIYCEFTDSKYTSILDFNVTFKVRDPLGTEIILVDDKPNGVDGTLIEYSGTVFIASYKWDPPTSVEPGNYDLYFGVMNRGGGFAEDGFTNNPGELTIVTSGNLPVITNVNCVPSSIPVQGTDVTEIYAEFTDADNPAKENFTVTFKVRDENNKVILLVDEKANGGAALTGGTVEVQTTGSGYIARYDWDPSDTNLTGNYDIYFTVKDETFAEAMSDFDDNLDILELTGGAAGPGTPDIQATLPTKDGNTYTFTITYTDEENDPPNDNGVELTIGTSTHKMTEDDTSDTNYTDGKTYTVSVLLPEGNHTYYFKTTDANNNLYQTENFELSVAAEPEPEPEDDDDDEDYTMLLIGVVLIIVIIIILIALLGMMKRKPKTSETPPPEPRAPAPEPEPAEPVAEPVTEPEPKPEPEPGAVPEPTPAPVPKVKGGTETPSTEEEAKPESEPEPEPDEPPKTDE